MQPFCEFGKMEIFKFFLKMAATPPIGAGYVSVGVAFGCGLIQGEIVQRSVSGFSEAEKVQFIVSDEFM